MSIGKKCQFVVLPAAVLVAMFLAPLALRANSITETFTITQESEHLIPAPFRSTPFAQFDGTLGTLTGVTTTLTGSGIWKKLSPISPPPPPGTELKAFFLLEGPLKILDLDGLQTFSALGPITFDMSATNSSPEILATLTGSGTVIVDLGLTLTNGASGQFTTNGALQGTVTYNFTPAVPEPGMLSLSLLSLSALALVYFARKRRGHPVAQLGSERTPEGGAPLVELARRSG